jgi:hypothetical protein
MWRHSRGSAEGAANRRHIGAYNRVDTIHWRLARCPGGPRSKRAPRVVVHPGPVCREPRTRRRSNHRVSQRLHGQRGRALSGNPGVPTRACVTGLGGSLRRCKVISSVAKWLHGDVRPVRGIRSPVLPEPPAGDQGIRMEWEYFYHLSTRFPGVTLGVGRVRSSLFDVISRARCERDRCAVLSAYSHFRAVIEPYELRAPLKVARSNDMTNHTAIRYVTVGPGLCHRNYPSMHPLNGRRPDAV